MKALVMEIREDKAIVLKDDGTFEKIKNAGYSVGESIDIKKSPKIIRFSRKFSAIAAIVAVFVLVGSVYAYAYVTPYTSYTETTDDGGTEITYTVNRFNQVLSVKTVGDDSEDIDKEISFKKFAPVEKVKKETRAQLAAFKENNSIKVETDEDTGDLPNPDGAVKPAVKADDTQKVETDLPVDESDKKDSPKAAVSADNTPEDKKSPPGEPGDSGEERQKNEESTDSFANIEKPENAANEAGQDEINEQGNKPDLKTANEDAPSVKKNPSAEEQSEPDIKNDTANEVKKENRADESSVFFQ